MNADDIAAKQQQLRELENYVLHPYTQQILAQLKADEEGLINIITKQPVTDLETFFSHFQAVGNLTGVRAISASLYSTLEELKEQITNA